MGKAAYNGFADLELPLRPNRFVKKVIELRRVHSADIVLVEDAASGTSLIQVLRERGLVARAVKPTGDKIVRMSAGSALIEGGHIFLPAGPTCWRDNYIAELLSFPNGVHDDMVDATPQFLGWLAERRKAPQAGVWFNGKFQPLTNDPTIRNF
jgi:predicted phage terminase large subunit-like protein